MIVREDKDHYIFITQHDHAYIAGEFLAHFKKEFVAVEYYESLKFAIHQHDRAWLIPDANPLLNDEIQKPFSFIDYPDKLKFHFLKLGIDQVDLANSYAAILCSMHHASFYHNNTNETAKQFHDRELQRQKHLMNKLKIPHDRLLSYQLKILQFCDDLSMYICLNKPGVDKDYEVDVYKRGFLGTEFFHKGEERKIIAFFKDKDRNNVSFNSSVFENTFEIKLPLKRIAKKLIKEIGIAASYQFEPTVNITYKFFS